MLRIKKELVPLYGGSSGKGLLHIVYCDAKGYNDLIKHIDKGDMITSEIEPYPSFYTFSGLAYQRNHKDGHDDWWVIFPKTTKNDYKEIRKAIRGFNKNTKYKGKMIKRKDNGSMISINTISHEGLHIAGMVLDSRGVRYERNNDEPFTYMMGWVTETICKGLPKNIIKI